MQGFLLCVSQRRHNFSEVGVYTEFILEPPESQDVDNCAHAKKNVQSTVIYLI